MVKKPLCNPIQAGEAGGGWWRDEGCFASLFTSNDSILSFLTFSKNINWTFGYLMKKFFFVVMASQFFRVSFDQQILFEIVFFFYFV